MEWCREETWVVGSLEEGRKAVESSGDTLDAFRVVICPVVPLAEDQLDCLRWSFLPVGMLTDVEGRPIGRNFVVNREGWNGGEPNLECAEPVVWCEEGEPLHAKPAVRFTAEIVRR